MHLNKENIKGNIGNLQHHGIEFLGGVNLLGHGQNGAGFACSWRAIEQQMRETVFLHKFIN